MRLKVSFPWVAGVFLLAGCALHPCETPPAPLAVVPSPAAAPPPATDPATVAAPPAVSPPEAGAAAASQPSAAEVGFESVATYYAKRFNGRPTITDEIYDPEKLTAATHEVPLGTRVKVVNPKNGKEVIVRVNDRPRKRKFPLIDLSRAAARQLGFLGQGKIKVRVIPLATELPPAEPENLSAAEPSPSDALR